MLFGAARSGDKQSAQAHKTPFFKKKKIVNIYSKKIISCGSKIIEIKLKYMQAKYYLIILIFALIGLSNNLQAQDAKERAVVEKALKVWLENEKIKCANHFDKKFVLEKPITKYLFSEMEKEEWLYYGFVETNLLAILNKRSVELCKQEIPLGEIAKAYYTTLDSCLIHLPSIMEKDKPSIFTIPNLLAITEALESFTIANDIRSEGIDIIYMYKK